MPGFPWAFRVYDALNQGDYFSKSSPQQHRYHRCHAMPLDTAVNPSKPFVLDAVEAEKAVLEGYSTDTYSKKILNLDWLI